MNSGLIEWAEPLPGAAPSVPSRRRRVAFFGYVARFGHTAAEPKKVGPKHVAIAEIDDENELIRLILLPPVSEAESAQRRRPVQRLQTVIGPSRQSFFLSPSTPASDSQRASVRSSESSWCS